MPKQASKRRKSRNSTGNATYRELTNSPLSSDTPGDFIDGATTQTDGATTQTTTQTFDENSIQTFGVEPPRTTTATHGTTEPSTATKTPAFLQKLFKILNDSESNKYIHWSQSGLSFVISHPEELSKKVLPFYFKHSNFTSFIRQLNMYGFKKVQNINQGSLHAISHSDAAGMEFENEFFVKDRQDLLCLISRKKPQKESLALVSAAAAAGGVGSNTANVGETGQGPTDHFTTSTNTKDSLDIALLLQEMNNIKFQQLQISQEIANIQSQNQIIWSQSQDLHHQYNAQKDTIEKILGFLASVFSKKGKIDSATTSSTAPGPSTADSLVIHQKKPQPSPSSFQQGTLIITINNNTFDIVDSSIYQSQIASLLKGQPIQNPTLQNPFDFLASSPFSTTSFTPPDLQQQQQVLEQENLTEKTNRLSQDIDLLNDRLFDISNLVGLPDSPPPPAASVSEKNQGHQDPPDDLFATFINEDTSQPAADSNFESLFS